MLHRIEVSQKSPNTDSPAHRILKIVRDDFGIPAESASLIRVYTLEMDLRTEELDRVGTELFHDPITEIYAVDKPLAGEFDWLIEAGFKPGVTDNVGRSAREGIADTLGRKLGDEDQVYTSRQVLLRGPLNREHAIRIATSLLANDLIETWQVVSREEWNRSPGIVPVSRKVLVPHQPSVREIELPPEADALQQLSDEKLLSLTLEEMQAVRTHFADPQRQMERKKRGLPASPTDVELEMIAQTWSEHCKHKIFAADVEYTDDLGKTQTIRSLFKTFVKAATDAVKPQTPWLKSVFTDNAGIIAFCEGWDVAMKAETHNSPSALDPYGGAMTGIVGVNRDILGCGMGCKPIFNTNVFCFASPFYDKPVPDKLHPPKRLLKEVHRGVKDGGNESGIPTVNGSIVFDDRYLGKPLVFCGTGGLIPSELHGKPSWQKSIAPGDRIARIAGHEVLTPLDLVVGVNRGRNFTGDVGHPWRRTYSISGDATNLAARIMAHAEPGQLLVHAPVLDRVRGRVRAEPVAPFHAKGKAAPVETVDLEGIRSTREVAEALTTPMLGRDDALHMVEAAIASGGTAEVTGPAGVGKTRLVEEALAAAGAPGPK